MNSETKQINHIAISTKCSFELRIIKESEWMKYGRRERERGRGKKARWKQYAQQHGYRTTKAPETTWSNTFTISSHTVAIGNNVAKMPAWVRACFCAGWFQLKASFGSDDNSYSNQKNPCYYQNIIFLKILNNCR